MTGVPRRDRRPLFAVGIAVAVMLVAGVGVLTLTAWSWGAALEDDRRLLPGVTIAGTDVGEQPVDDALAAVLATTDPWLDHSVTVTHDEVTRLVRARDLGATLDADDVVEAARAASASASLLELVRIRWLGATSELAFVVAVMVPEDEVEGFVSALARDVDRDPQDASIDWADDGVELSASTIGRRLDQGVATDELTAALVGGTAQLALPVDELPPTISTELAEQVLPAVADAVDGALDRVVTISHDDATWEVSARDLGAVPDVATVTGSALGAQAVRTSTEGLQQDVADVDDSGEVPLAVPEEDLQTFVAEMAASIDVAARNASLDSSSGWLEIVPDRTGIALDRDAAAEELLAALRGAGSEVELSTVTVQPSVTTGSFDRVLFLRQNDRRVYLYVDGEIAREWPVAVGQGGSPTPTGQFTVGAKRFEPTWHNPAPNGWGADMPAVIGPGPQNPLGLRALNWNRGGSDTLIRFHGTPNESSIGQAASQGCVRMFNSDVIELYDLVPTGTAIVSING